MANEIFTKYVSDQMEFLKTKFDELGDQKQPIRVLVSHAGSDISYYKALERDCEKLGIKIINRTENIYIPTILMGVKDIPWDQGRFIEQADIDCMYGNKYYESPIGQGICDYLEHQFGGSLRGRTVAIVGRGKLAGGPITKSLFKRGATVLACNSSTGYQTTHDIIAFSDVFISAINKPEYFELIPSIPTKSIVIDCGCCWSDQKQKLVGNIAESALDKFEENGGETIRFFKGTGILTRIGLLKNACRCMRFNASDDNGDMKYSDWNKL